MGPGGMMDRTQDPGIPWAQDEFPAAPAPPPVQELGIF